MPKILYIIFLSITAAFSTYKEIGNNSAEESTLLISSKFKQGKSQELKPYLENWIDLKIGSKSSTISRNQGIIILNDFCSNHKIVSMHSIHSHVADHQILVTGTLRTQSDETFLAQFTFNVIDGKAATLSGISINK